MMDTFSSISACAAYHSLNFPLFVDARDLNEPLDEYIERPFAARHLPEQRRRRHSSLGQRTPDVVYFDATSFGTAA